MKDTFPRMPIAVSSAPELDRQTTVILLHDASLLDTARRIMEATDDPTPDVVIDPEGRA